LYGVEPNDPIAIMMAVALLFVSGLFAGFIPARRASLIDPLRAMRCE
jgi:ABC-type lipoprotein release transport system permease subunit